MTLVTLNRTRETHRSASSVDALPHPRFSRGFLHHFLSLLQRLISQPRNQVKRCALKRLVSEFKRQHGEIQVAKEEVLAIRRHFDLMDMNYVRAGYNAELVWQHIALSQQAKENRKPAVLVKECPEGCSSQSCQIFPSDFPGEGTCFDQDHQFAAFQVHAYFPLRITESALRKAFELALVPIVSLSIFNCSGASLEGILVVALVNCNKTGAPCTAFDENPRAKTSSDASNSLRADEVGAQEGFFCIVGRLRNILEALFSYTSPNSCSMEVDTFKSDLVHLLFDHDNNVVSGKALISNYLIDLDDLEIGESIGGGASGEVYKGLYKGQKVAVKKLRGMTKGSRTEGEFRREILGLISCAHKNVLKLYGVCLDSEHGICIVTKFMEGGSLLQYLEQKQGLKMKEVLRLAKDVAKGMEFLHSRGVVHMDLKTANVFLDNERNAVIGDMGVARLATEKVESGETIGTYRWMAPEVCGAESGDTGSFSPKSDVYSFGILLWELITCQTPYADYNPVQAAVGVVMHGLRPAIPSSCFAPLRYLIEKCWDQNPAVRPSFSQIVQMLQIISKDDWNLSCNDFS